MKLVRWLSAMLIVVLFSVFVSYRVLHAYWYKERNFTLQEPTLTIRQGDSLSRVIRQLKQQQIIDNPNVAKLCLRLFNTKLVIKAGEYKLSKNMSYAMLFSQLASGVSLQYKLTFIEGQTVLDALQIVVKRTADIIKPESIEAVNRAEQIKWLKTLLLPEAQAYLAQDAIAEGWFFPDTYYFSASDSPHNILLRAHKKMWAVLAEEWSYRQVDLPYANRYEALILASVIERETGVAYERAQIAGVFVRRLKLHMRLQTDPTVIYGLGDNFSGNLKRADLKRDQPYNTYTRHGLPPTPIALPGRAAIHAALHPADGDALYFVAKGDGSHHFSATLKEHLQAVRQYQIINRRAEYRSAPAVIPKNLKVN